MGIFRRKVVAAAVKLEPTSGTDATPSLATDALRFKGIPEVTIAFVEDGKRNDVALAVLGIAGRALPAGRYASIEFTIEVCGKGSAYSAVTDLIPGDALYQMAGKAKSFAAGALTFADADSGLPTGTIYVYTVDGLLIKIIGAVAKPKYMLEAGKVVAATFSCIGIVATDPASATISGLALTTVVPPVWGNTTASLGAWTTATAAPNAFAPRKVTIDEAPVVATRPWAGNNTLLPFVIVDRLPTIDLECEVVALSTFDPYAQGRSAKSATDTDTQFTTTLGSGAGNIVTITTGAAQLAPPKGIDLGGIAGWGLAGEILAKSLATGSCSLQLVFS